jgi:hypothetical protein
MQRMKQLDDENRRLKQIVAEQTLDMAVRNRSASFRFRTFPAKRTCRGLRDPLVHKPHQRIRDCQIGMAFARLFFDGLRKR